MALYARIKIANHVSPEMHREVNRYIKDPNQTRSQVMKRLIKKATFFDVVDIKGELFDIYKNPNINEINKVYNEENVIRGVILSNNDIYVWNGVVPHDVMGSYSNVDVGQFRFAYDNEMWYFNPRDKYTAEQMKEMIVKYEDKLANIGNLNAYMHIEYEDFMGIKELKESITGGK